MRRTHLLPLVTVLTVLLLGALLVCPARPAAAEDAKPFATISFAGYDALAADLDHIGKLGGNANLRQAVEGLLMMVTQGKGLEGLDKTRPLGVAVYPGPTNPLDEPDILAFVPVSDSKKLLASLAGAGMPVTDGPNGSKQIGPDVFVKQVGDWAFVSNKPANLDKTPADPIALLGGAEKKYDAAIRLLVKDVPSEKRQVLIGNMEMFVQFMTMQAPNESTAAQFKQMVDQVKKLANELDTLTLGFVINDAAGKTYLDVEVTAKPGSDTAAEMADMKKAPSGYAGFYVPEATLTANWVGKMSAAKIAQTVSAIENMHKEFVQALENQNLDEKQLEKAKQLVGDLVSVFINTVKAGKSDGGTAVWLDAKTAAIVAGGAIVDGEKLETTLKEIVSLATADTPELKQFLKLDADTCQGVKLHTFTMPLPPEIPGRDKIVELTGENLDVVVGTSPTGAYLAVGRDAMTKLKAAIKASKSATGDVLPTRGSLAVTPLAQFIAKIVDDESVKQRVTMVAGLMEQAGSDNHVLVTIEPISNGVRERIEIESGILKVLGSLSAMAAPPSQMTPPSQAAPGGPKP